MDWSFAVVLGVLIVFFTGPSSVTERLLSVATLSRPTTVFLICFAALNWKGLPLVWHFRAFRAVLFPGFIHPCVYDGDSNSELIFQPLTTSSRSPLWECDLMGHKSNSSYYSDLDIARADLIAHLFGGGMSQLSRSAHRAADGRVFKSRVLPIMGGATMVFKKEIAPYQLYEMETRILCWDKKWIYFLTQFVYDKKGKREVSATAIMKLVFKSGRVTVQPEVLLQASGLVPHEDDALQKVEIQRAEGFKLAERCGAVADPAALMGLSAANPGTEQM